MEGNINPLWKALAAEIGYGCRYTFFALLIAKVVGALKWSWWVVFSPLIFSTAILFIGIIIIAIIVHKESKISG